MLIPTNEAFQGLFDFTASFLGMAVYMKLYCPNGRCCHRDAVTELLECTKRLKSVELKKESR